MVHVVARAQIHMGLLLCDAALHRRDLAAAAKELQSVLEFLPSEPEALLFVQWAEELEGRLAHLRAAGHPVELTAAEFRVLQQLPTHRSLVEIGEHLYVSRNTVKTHTQSIYRKLGCRGRSEAVARAAGSGSSRARPLCGDCPVVR